MKKINAILQWKQLIESAIPEIQDFRFAVVDDYLKNGTNYTVFSTNFKSIKELFSDFEVAMYSLSQKEKSKLSEILGELQECIQGFINNFDKIYLPELNELIVKESRTCYPVINIEEFLQTNRVKQLYDYCLKTEELINSYTQKPNKEKQDLSFSGFLNFDTQAKRDAFANEFINNYKGTKKNREFALLLYSLFILGFIQGKRGTIYKCLRNIGWDIGTQQNLDDIYSKVSQGYSGYDEDVNSYKTILSKLSNDIDLKLNL